MPRTGMILLLYALGFLMTIVSGQHVGKVVDTEKMEIKHESEVFVMTDDNFHHLTQSHETGLVLFHVPWDGRFKAILPEFEKVAQKLEHQSVFLGKLDVSLYPDIAEELDIRGDDPQLIYFHQNKPYSFEDFKSASQLLTILKDRATRIWNPPRPHPDLVPELNAHEFHQSIKGLDFAVVAFYRTHCPACVRLILEYETAVVNLTEKATDKVKFYKTNLDSNPALAEEFAITDVPILKIFRKGKLFNFSNRERLSAGILQYINKQLQPPYKQFKSIEEAEGWLRSYPNKGGVLGIFTSDKHDNFEAFQDVANFLRDDLNFAFVNSKAPTGDWLINAYPPLRHVSPQDKRKFAFDEEPYFEKLVKFIKSKTRPLVGQRTMRNKDTIYADRPLVVGYTDVDWSKAREHDTQYHRDKISQMVHGYTEFTFAISDKKEFKHELVRMNLDKSSEELLVGLIGTNGEYYAGPIVDIMNLKILSDLCKSYRENKLKPFHRTQSPPTHDDSEDYAVKAVVGATFRKLILRHEKEVLLLLHRPGCPACKKAMKVFEEVAEEKEYPHLMYATMDTLGNDAPARFMVNSTYPMMYFVPFDKSVHPTPYPTRKFSKEKVKEFIKANAHRNIVRSDL